MARGTINGRKINVTNFTRNNDSKEEVYRVVVSGPSTAEASFGDIIRSNAAVILHEKHAWIQFSGECTADQEMCNGLTAKCLLIETKNIRKDTVYVKEHPTYIESYQIERLTDTRYKLKYCCYPTYGTAGREQFVINGIDIYGNTISSAAQEVNPNNTREGTVKLHQSGSQDTAVTLNSYATSCNLVYELSQEIDPDTVSINSTAGTITNIAITDRKSVV